MDRPKTTADMDSKTKDWVVNSRISNKMDGVNSNHPKVKAGIAAIKEDMEILEAMAKARTKDG